MPPTADDPPLPPGAPAPPAGDAPVPVTRALVDAFLALKTTQARIVEVVRSRSPEKRQRADIENMVQDANVKALTSTKLPRSAEKLRPWVSRIAQHTVIDFFRREAVELKWMRGDIDVEELPPDPVDAPEDEVSEAQIEAMEGSAGEGAAPPDQVVPIGPWVRIEIGRRKEPHRSRDAMIVEMLAYRAAHRSMTDEVLAATFGLTRDQYKHRLAAFKARYLPMRKRYVERRNTFLWILLLLAVAVAGYLFWPRRPLEPVGPDPDAKPLVPRPSASVAPPPKPTFNQAVPTPEPSTGPK